MDAILDAVLTRGDLAHLALLLWAAAASGLLLLTIREIFELHRRYDAFVRELNRFNERTGKAP